jgi:hypothetical protein
MEGFNSSGFAVGDPDPGGAWWGASRSIQVLLGADAIRPSRDFARLTSNYGIQH